MAALQVLFWVEFVFSVMLQMKDILKINIFSIGTHKNGTKSEGL